MNEKPTAAAKPTAATAPKTAVFTPRNTPNPPPLPGTGVPATPGGTSWVPDGPNTGVKPPGWFTVFFEVLKAYLANAHLSSQGVADDSIIDLASNLTDRLLARYPLQFRVDPVAPTPAPAALRPFSK
jgi:hypothetical protein